MQTNTNTEFTSMARRTDLIHRSAMMRIHRAIMAMDEHDHITTEAYCLTCRCTIGGDQVRNHLRIGHHISE